MANVLKRPSITGLTYVEVMVSTLVAAVFVSTTLQGYLAATSLRVKTRQVEAAMAAVQADMERIRQMAQVRPSSITDCALPPSSSYAQQLLGQVLADNTASLSLTPQSPTSPPLGATVAGGGQSTLQSTTRLPPSGQFRDYQIDRTLSVATDRLPVEQVLQLAYVVRKQSADFRSAQGNAPSSSPFKVEAPSVAQLHTTILPTAALVCF